ncbi:MAG: hypothetical protein RL095_1263 [Verrucomicrobiota bacterium]|jgi:UDP-N-acetylmuramate--alanine ligase
MTQPSTLFPWKQVHFVGIGGVGMSGLARLLLAEGVGVSGSDLEDSSYTRRLRAMGAEIAIGAHAAEHVPPGTDLLVYSSAVSAENPERLKAQSLGIRQNRRGEFLAELATFFPRLIAVGGSHGKTSCTSMIAWVLKECRVPACWIIGGEPIGLEPAGHCPGAEILVTEADESDGTLACLQPEIGLLLNAEDDHSWSNGGESGLALAFRRFCLNSRHLVYGRGGMADAAAEGLDQAIALDPHDPSIGVEVPQLGRHNRFNARVALLAALQLGVEESAARAALARFPGVKRRATIHLQRPGLTLIEDYAHHPTELKAFVQSLAEARPGAFVIAIFQAHRYERVEKYGDEFAVILRAFDRVLYTPPFAAWIPHDQVPPMQRLADITGSTAEVLEGEDWQAHAGNLLAQVPAGRDVVIAVIGAATVTRVIPHLLQRLASP